MVAKIRSLLRFIAENFGPLVVFYVANYWLGLRVAVATSVVFALAAIVYKKVRGSHVTPFFLFSAGVTVFFGALDLCLTAPVFIKYEAAFTNVITGLYFGGTLFTARPLIQEFAERDGPIVGATPREDLVYFFRFLTWIWTLYFFVKAAAYAWVSAHYPLEEALALRTVAGSVTFYALLGASMFLAKPVLKALSALKLLPSTRRI